MPAGRPSEYTEEIGLAVCQSLEAGKSLLQTCRDLNLTESTIYRWRDAHEGFRENYTRARENGDDIEFERLWELASEQPQMGEKGVDSGWVTWKRNQIDTAKWMLARKRPKKYGEKIDHTLAAPDGGPVQSSITVTFVKPKAD